MSILAEQADAALPEGVWTVDPSHSAVEFLVRHMGLTTVRGRAPVLEATITGGPEPAIAGTVDASSLTTFDEARDAHLRSPEFFDVERYPQLSFTSTSVRAAGSELAVSGLLTIKGAARPVALAGTILGTGIDPWGNERLALELSGSIDRTEFGLAWNAPLPGGGFLLPDTVDVVASFSAVRRA